MNSDFDVVVIGAGLAGLSAAVTAAESGARTLVLERAATIGGSAAISGGYVWTVPDIASLHREDSGRYQRHGQLVVDGYQDAMNWLTSYSPPLTDEQPSLAGRGRKFDMGLVFAQLLRALYAAGGRVIVDAEVTDVSRSEGSYRCAAVTPDGGLHLSARSLILASGGRQADPAVRAELVGGSYVPPLRANPWSRGTGAAIAASLGASINTDNRGFYGHLFAADVQVLAPIDYITFALYHSTESVLTDLAGERFTDERRGDHNNAMALAAHGGRGLLFWSEAVQVRAASAPFIPGSPQLDRWAFSRDRGGRVAVAEDVSGLVSAVQQWGGSADFHLDDKARSALGTGRVFAADVVPAVTFTFGGIEVNDAGLVIDADGDPIDSLYAVGADMSDAYHQGYGGGLCLAVVTGRRAGSLAAAVPAA
jgi:tricarballylate dehydrogenase